MLLLPITFFQAIASILVSLGISFVIVIFNTTAASSIVGVISTITMVIVVFTVIVIVVIAIVSVAPKTFDFIFCYCDCQLSLPSVLFSCLLPF